MIKSFFLPKIFFNDLPPISSTLSIFTKLASDEVERTRLTGVGKESVACRCCGIDARRGRTHNETKLFQSCDIVINNSAAIKLWLTRPPHSFHKDYRSRSLHPRPPEIRHFNQGNESCRPLLSKKMEGGVGTQRSCEKSYRFSFERGGQEPSVNSAAANDLWLSLRCSAYGWTVQVAYCRRGLARFIVNFRLLIILMHISVTARSLSLATELPSFLIKTRPSLIN